MSFRQDIAELGSGIRSLASKATGRGAGPDLEEKAVSVVRKTWEAYGLLEVGDFSNIDIERLRDWAHSEPAVTNAMSYLLDNRLADGYTIEPVSDDAVDIEAADFIRDQLDDMEGSTDEAFKRLLRAPALGLAIEEIVYRPIVHGRWRGKWGLKRLKPTGKVERFKIEPDEFGNLLPDSIKQRQGFNKWLTIDPDYLIVWSFDHNGNWKGRAKLLTAFKWGVIKDLISKLWPIFLEKYAHPTPVAKYPKNAKEKAKKEMLAFLETLHVRKGAVVPDGWDLNILESIRRGGDYKEILAYCDRMMEKALDLPSLVTAEGTSGSYSLGEKHAETFERSLVVNGRIFADLLREQLFRRLIRWNFNVDSAPRLIWNPITKEDPFKDKGELVLKYLEKGYFDPLHPWVAETLDVPPDVFIEPADEEKDPPDEDSEEDGSGEGAELVASPASRLGRNDEPVSLSLEDFADHDSPAAALAVFAAKASSLKHGKKVDFRGKKKTLDRLAGELSKELARIVKEEWLAGLIATVRKKKVLDEAGGSRAARYAIIDKLAFSRGSVGRFKDAWLRAYAWSIHEGAYSGRLEVEKGLGQELELPETMKRSLAVDPADFSIPAREAIAAFVGKVPIQKELLAEYTRRSFTIAGLYRDRLLNDAKLLVEDALRRGSSIRELEAALGNLFNPYLEREGAIDPGLGKAYRLENIARTNTAEAFNLGRRDLFFSADVKPFINAFEYSAVLDERTTDFCNAWHGTKLDRDDPLIFQLTPPNHYQCRAEWIPITTGEIYELSPEIPSDRPPAEFII